MTPDAALDALRAQVEPGRAEQMIAYHKQSRAVLGVGNEVPKQHVITFRQIRTYRNNGCGFRRRFTFDASPACG